MFFTIFTLLIPYRNTHLDWEFSLSLSIGFTSYLCSFILSFVILVVTIGIRVWSISVGSVMVSTYSATALAMGARVEDLERRMDNQGWMLEMILQ